MTVLLFIRVLFYGFLPRILGAIVEVSRNSIRWYNLNDETIEKQRRCDESG
jgi:hypothetical protein